MRSQLILLLVVASSTINILALSRQDHAWDRAEAAINAQGPLLPAEMPHR